MKKITEVKDLKGKRIIVRSSFNVPIKDGKVANSFRIMKALGTLRYLREAGARVIVIGHIGRNIEDTLKPVHEVLEDFIPVRWGGRITDSAFLEHVALMSDGDVLLAENLRQDEREEENDMTFASLIASFGDVYVNDAFDNTHREHASMSALATLLPAYAGLNVIEEVTQLEKVVMPHFPALFLLGGAKFETKMPLVEKYLEIYDHVFIAGALMNDIFKAKGYEVGQSLVSEMSLVGAPFLDNQKLLLPLDVVVESEAGKRVCAPDEVRSDERIMDCGPETIAMLTPYVMAAKTVLWNGPFGAYEKGYIESTEATAKLLAEATAFSVVGGGDSVAAIEKLGLNEKLGFVSTGGGAMLTFLEHGGTPVLDLLN